MEPLLSPHNQEVLVSKWNSGILQFRLNLSIYFGARLSNLPTIALLDPSCSLDDNIETILSLYDLALDKEK